MVLASLALLVPLALVIAVVAFVARLARNDNDHDLGSFVRQFFQHVIAVSLAFVAASGVSRLLAIVVSGPSLVHGSQGLAGPVAFTVVGVPLYVAMMWWLLGRARNDGREAGSVAWSIHLGVVGVTALSASLAAVFNIYDAVMGSGSLAAAGAALVVWAALWAWYRWLEHRRVGSDRWAILHVIVGSAIGLVTMMVGFGGLVEAAIEVVVFPDTTMVVVDDPVRSGVAIIIGGAIWTVYWVVDGMRRPRDAWWHGWVLLGGVFAGLVTAVGAGAYLLFEIAVSLVGQPGTDAASHFADTPATIATLVSGLVVWGYHHSILIPRARRARTEVDRVHDLLLAAVGLGATATGGATILVAIMEAIAGPGTVLSGSAPINTLLAAVTAVAVGSPVWWRAWSRVQHIGAGAPLGSDRDPDEQGPDEQAVGEQQPGGQHAGALSAEAVAERGSRARRVYLFILFGAGGVAALVALLVAVTVGLEDLFAGRFGAETLYSMRIALAVLVTAAAVAALHWSVYRNDRDTVDTIPRRFPTRITLVGPADPDIVAALRDATDARVELWVRTDLPDRPDQTDTNGFAPWSLDEVTTALHDRDHDHVLAILGHDGVQPIPVADRTTATTPLPSSSP